MPSGKIKRVVYLEDGIFVDDNGEPIPMDAFGIPAAGLASLALVMPSEFGVAGSPASGIGTITVEFSTQAAGTFFAGPGSGPDAVPEFRALVEADLPAISDPGDVFVSTTIVGMLQELYFTKEDKATPSGNFLISGGGVAFTSGLNLIVSAATYVIQGSTYTSAETALTATAADPTNPRIDVVAVNSSGTAVIIPGTPAVNPEKPDVDPASQLELTFFLVPAAATDLDVYIVDVYHENTEWTTSRSGSTITLAGATMPRDGAVSLDGTAVTTGNYVQFQAGASIDLNNFDNLVFYIRSKAAWPSTRSLALTFRQAGTQRGSVVTLAEGSYGFVSANTTGYQQIVIPVSAFGASGLAVNQLRMTCAGSGATIGFYIDDITLQGGLATTTDATRMRWRGNWNNAVLYEKNDVVFTGNIQYVAIQAGVNQNPATATTYWQQSSATPGAAGVTDHGALTGLADDDHPQYHTDARGDARYSLLGHTHSYLDQATADTLYAPLTQPFDIHIWYPAIPSAANALLFRGPVGRAITFPANFAGSRFAASANATGSTVFTLNKNGSAIGTVTIAAGTTTATFATTGGTSQSCVAGDVLSLVGPASADATLADPGFVFVATR